ncbi:ASCH domain-containing protein [Phreatobacter oligotrophus]|uniref:ASCH domain-containing protein n=1 Tax=Phreatobacter oligotrophus TaxID=1122261 RepID=A0A2T4ZIQ4_9HYPH|nr:ASCH domain-containing protein [Phreatobacter oligotrophus]PTM61865.1 hypothetical protein C8P69_101537 [Phreatobacter oligotrophus]
MKVLTIWQPWATLIMAGAKPYEFRGWIAPVSLQGKRIGIHAGKRPVRKAEIQDLIVRLRSANAWSTCLKPEALPLLERWHQRPDMLPVSCVLGTAVLGRPRSGHDVAAEFGGPVNDSDRHGHANWAWPLTDIRQFEPPWPMRGAQGFWDLQVEDP